MKKSTVKEMLKKLEEEENRLAKDEGAWLKSLGELGDFARLLVKLQERVSTLQTRVEKLEGGTKK